MYSLFARAGWGSVLVEAQLAWYGLEYQVEAVGDLFKEPHARDQLLPANPIAQIPTLLLPDGTVMTESAAITLLLADITARTDLAPGASNPSARNFCAGSSSLSPISTRPSPMPTTPHGSSATRSAARLFAPMWTPTRSGSGVSWRRRRGPWFLGDRFSAVDIFIATMTQWRPQRPWFAAHTPKLAAIATRTDALPELASVWERNFPRHAEP